MQGIRWDALSKDSIHTVVAGLGVFPIEGIFHKDRKKITNSLESFKTLIREHQKNSGGTRPMSR